MLSPEIEDEYLSLPLKHDIRRLIARKGSTTERFAALIRQFCALAERVSPTGEPPPCRDEKDRKYLHCAVAGRVDYLVTYDRDLLDLGAVEGIPIVTPSELVPQLR